MLAQFLRSIVIALVALFSSKTVQAQSSSSWSYGIASQYSFETHTLNWTSYPQGEPTQRSKNKFTPAFAGGAGIWTEKKISNVFSIYSRLDYHYLRFDDQYLSGWYIKVGGGRNYQEWHNSLSLSLHGRFYIPTKSKLKVYFDAGAKVDRMVKFRSRYAHFDFRRWNPQYMNAVSPALIGAIGIQYGHLGLSLESQNYIWNDALTEDLAARERQQMFSRDVSRRNLTLNLSYRLNFKTSN
jgi:hypothetical protein